ncbi:MAG: type IV secretory system conjugative DNA transfer family protein [Aeromicrobium sp.]
MDPDLGLELLDRVCADHNVGPVAFEARAHNAKITYLVGAQPGHIANLQALISSLVTDVRVSDPKAHARKPMTFAGHLKTSHSSLALNVDRVTAVTRSVLAGLVSATGPDEDLVLQVLIGGRLAPRFVAPDANQPTDTWFDLAWRGRRAVNADTRTSMKTRASLHGAKVTVRLGANAASSGRIQNLITQTLGGLRVAQAAGVRINFARESAVRLNRPSIPWRYPLALSSKELVALMGWPLDKSGDVALPGQPAKHPQQLAADVNLLASRRPFAETTAPGLSAQVGISARDSLHHTLLLGPTGSGKSTAMLAMIMDAIRDGRSVLVIDPKADLVNDVLARIPDERADDVVVIDPTSRRPVGLNPLRRSERHAALTADSMLAVFKELSGESWGPRTADVLTSALMTLAHHKGATLAMLPALLTDTRFRHRITKEIDDHLGLSSFWTAYDAMSPQQRAQVIAPAMTRLRQFLLRPQLRAVLGQADPEFDLADLFSKHRIVLVSLNKGLIGAEGARLLGSLIVGQLWPLILAQGSKPPERRRIVNLYIDEVQDYIALPTNLEDALAQSRGLGVSWTIAHQYRRQLPPALRSGVDANTANKVIFGLNAEDANELAKQVPTLEAADFMYLPRFGAYMVLKQNDESTGWFAARTLAPDAPIRVPAELRARSETAYGRDAAEVELEVLKAIGMDRERKARRGDFDEPIGRRPISGGRP